MDIFNREKVAFLELRIKMLEQDVELYKSRCTQLENEAKSVKDLELKVKCLQMWCDDDEAIDELMSATRQKEKKPDLCSDVPIFNDHRLSAAARAQSIGLMGGLGSIGMNTANTFYRSVAARGLF